MISRFQRQAFTVGGVFVQIEPNGRIYCTEKMIRVASMRQEKGGLYLSSLVHVNPVSRWIDRPEMAAVRAVQWYLEDVEDKERRLKMGVSGEFSVGQEHSVAM